MRVRDMRKVVIILIGFGLLLSFNSHGKSQRDPTKEYKKRIKAQEEQILDQTLEYELDLKYGTLEASLSTQEEYDELCFIMAENKNEIHRINLKIRSQISVFLDDFLFVENLNITGGLITARTSETLKRESFLKELSLLYIVDLDNKVIEQLPEFIPISIRVNSEFKGQDVLLSILKNREVLTVRWESDLVTKEVFLDYQENYLKDRPEWEILSQLEWRDKEYLAYIEKGRDEKRKWQVLEFYEKNEKGEDETCAKAYVSIEDISNQSFQMLEIEQKNVKRELEGVSWERIGWEDMNFDGYQDLLYRNLFLTSLEMPLGGYDTGKQLYLWEQKQNKYQYCDSLPEKWEINKEKERLQYRYEYGIDRTDFFIYEYEEERYKETRRLEAYSYDNKKITDDVSINLRAEYLYYEYGRKTKRLEQIQEKTEDGNIIFYRYYEGEKLKETIYKEEDILHVLYRYFSEFDFYPMG